MPSVSSPRARMDSRPWPLNVSGLIASIRPRSGRAGTIGPWGRDDHARVPARDVPARGPYRCGHGAGVFNGVRITPNDPKADHDHGPLLLKAVFTKGLAQDRGEEEQEGEVTAVVEQQQPS